jgi:glutamine amidotransferase
MIIILDYGMGNTASILNMIHRVGGDAVISSDTQKILEANALILPGVGAFDNAMQKLNESGLLDLIRQRVQEDNVPFMGICLGMQLLFESSEEGALPGLGLVSGEIKKFAFHKAGQESLKIPHMGWNVVQPVAGTRMFNGFDRDPRFYFVHSYHAVCADSNDVAATCEYGYPFACAVQKDNIFAAQFHPEKSHKFGMQIFKNFLEQLC